MLPPDKIRFGMVGGGEGAFIGAVHRRAARMNGTLELVCGAFASDPDRSRASGVALGLDPRRCYPDFDSMCREERALAPELRMNFVSIVAPNHVHYPAAAAALSHGFHVLSDKPATLNLEECLALRDQVERTRLLYGLTHPYVAYPLIAEARDRVLHGELGTIRKVLVEYTQGWLGGAIERTANKQAVWRTDPALAGPSGCMGDIGVHAFNLAEYVCCLDVLEVCAYLRRTVPGRVLDDDGTVLLRFANGAEGVLIASQICVGEENNLRLRAYGDRGSLDWNQQEPNSLWIKYDDRPSQLLRTGGCGLSSAAARRTRLPAGHPEGLIEAFANIYQDFASQVKQFPDVKEDAWTSVTGIREALRGMAFVETVVKADASSAKWHAFPHLETGSNESRAAER